jgi:UDP-glucose 4-epimerase
MKIAVTGGAGFIASHLCDALVAAGHELLVIDDLSSGKRSQVPAAAQFVQADIRSPEAAAALTAFRPEILDHHAAQIDVRRSVADIGYDCDVNIRGLLNVVEAARKAGALKRVIFASSGGAIYDEHAPLPATETAPANPTSPYGVAKRTGELYLEAFRRMYGLHYVALRYANVYGPRQNAAGEAGVISIFATRCLRTEESLIYGDGGQTRDFVYVADVVRANVLALSSEFCGYVNVGTGVETDVNHLFSLIAASAGSDRPPRHLEKRVGEARRSAIDFGLATQVLGWRPEVALKVGLERTVDWFRANPTGQ